MRLELSVLGPLDVRVDGAVVTLPGRKHRLLVLALAHARGRPCSPDALVDAIWGDAPPASARKLVQLYVSQLRKALPEGVVVTEPSGYALHMPEDGLDAARFERLADEARRALDGENPELAAALARRAAALWRGSAYADAVYEDFVRAEAERLEELRLQVVEDRLEAELRLGRHDSTLADAVALAAEHPLRERPQELVMVALYRAGRQSEALQRYADFRRRLDDELGLEPGAHLRALQQRILRHDPGLATPERVGAVTSALPAATGRLIGRSAELERLHGILESRSSRLVVLTGAGGSGKTRLALEVAREAAQSFANGAVFVELAPLRDAALVPSTVAHAIGLGDAAAETEDALVDALVDLELLLVVDNAEHVREAAPLYARLVSRAPRVTILVTSRAVLHVTGEHVFPVAPLAENDAVELFVERAHLLSPSFSPEGADTEIREICRRLDGLPLAIELAAARTRALTPRALLERLDERLALLTAGPRDLPARQQTLRETIAWSVGLLDERARAVFRRLAVFPGGAALPAAEEVCGADPDTLGALVDDHLIQSEDVDGEPRFRMLETIREYALELLGDDRPAVELAMGSYLAELLDAVELEGRQSTPALSRVDPELDNVRFAIDACAAAGAFELQLRLAGGIWRFCWVRGIAAEGLRRIEEALAAIPDGTSTSRARALQGGAGLAWSLGDLERAKALAHEAVEVAAAAGSPWNEMAAHTVLGIVANDEGDRESARWHHRQGMEISERLGLDPVVQKLNLGLVALDGGDHEEARVLFDDVLAHHRRTGNNEGIGFALANLGLVHRALDDHEASLAAFREAHERFELIGFRAQVAHTLQGFAAYEATEGRFTEAARLLGEARAELDDVGVSETYFAADMVEWTKGVARDTIGDDAFEVAYEEGRVARHDPESGSG